MWNRYYQTLVDHPKTMLGDQSFIEFTVDPSGFELSAGTPKTDAYFSAPWALDQNTPAGAVPLYISVWDTIYSPSILASKRA